MELSKPEPIHLSLGFTCLSPSNIHFFKKKTNFWRKPGIVSPFYPEFMKRSMLIYKTQKSILKVLPGQLHIIKERNSVPVRVVVHKRF